MQMSDLEIVLLCLIIPVSYVLTYIAGKYDLLKLVANMLQEELEKLNEREELEKLNEREDE